VSLRLSIVTPARALVETDADSVVAPGSEGEFGVLPGHAPLLAALKAGVVRYSAGSASRRVAISAAALEHAGYAAPEEQLAPLREALGFAQARVDALRS